MKKTKNIASKIGKILLVFGIVFSQMSFPLNVLADEIITEDTIKTGEENPNTKEIPTPPELKEIVDFADEKVDNESKSFYIIKYKLDKTLTVKQLKDSREEVLVVLDDVGNEILDETTIVKSNYKVTISLEDDNTKDYTIIILGDFNNDGMVTSNDEEEVLKLLKTELTEEYINENINSLDLNKDGLFNILDATHPIFTTGSWENNKITTDNLKNYITVKEEVYVGENVEVNYSIDGFNIDKLSAFQGKLEYNNTLLELSSIEVAGISKDINELNNNKLIYLLNDYATNGSMIKLTFKALAKGEVIISINDIILASEGVAINVVDNENAYLEKNDVTGNINIINAIGGNPEEEEKTEEVTKPTISEDREIPVVSPVVLLPKVITPINHTVIEYVSLSNDNYIKSLIIKGNEIDFKKDVTTYSIKVENDVKSLEMTVILNDDSATYYVEGNKDFKVGKNVVNIIVTAEDGSIKIYTINVEKERKNILDEENVEKSTPSTSKKIIIILIILVIIGLIYVIFKDDEEDEVEVQKTKKEDNKKSNNVSNEKSTKSTSKENNTKTNKDKIKKVSKK